MKCSASGITIINQQTMPDQTQVIPLNSNKPYYALIGGCVPGRSFHCWEPAPPTVHWDRNVVNNKECPHSFFSVGSFPLMNYVSRTGLIFLLMVSLQTSATTLVFYWQFESNKLQSAWASCNFEFKFAGQEQVVKFKFSFCHYKTR